MGSCANEESSSISQIQNCTLLTTVRDKRQRSNYEPQLAPILARAWDGSVRPLPDAPHGEVCRGSASLLLAAGLIQLTKASTADRTLHHPISASGCQHLNLIDAARYRVNSGHRACTAFDIMDRLEAGPGGLTVMAYKGPACPWSNMPSITRPYCLSHGLKNLAYDSIHLRRCGYTKGNRFEWQ